MTREAAQIILGGIIALTEQGEPISKELIADARRSLEVLASPPLPVVRIEDCKLEDYRYYHVLDKQGRWLKDVRWDAGLTTFDINGTYSLGENGVTHVCESRHIVNTLNTSIQEES